MQPRYSGRTKPTATSSMFEEVYEENVQPVPAQRYPPPAGGRTSVSSAYAAARSGGAVPPVGVPPATVLLAPQQTTLYANQSANVSLNQSGVATAAFGDVPLPTPGAALDVPPPANDFATVDGVGAGSSSGPPSVAGGIAPSPSLAAAASGPETVVGIDLGTTFSVIAHWDWNSKKVELISNEHGRRTNPSMVSYSNNDLYIGDAAKQRAITNPDSTVYHVKRMIGRTYTQVMEEFLPPGGVGSGGAATAVSPFPFKLVQGPNDKLKIEVQFRGEACEVAPEEVSGLVLFKLKELAEAKLKRPVKKAVITVPAYFTEPQKRATKEAGELAGLEILGLLPEPTAAALAYGIDRRSMTQAKKDKMAVDGWYILVFDLGGGTFDVSILKLDGRGSFVVKAVTGDFHLGGMDFDNVLLNHFKARIARDFPQVNLTSDKTLARLRQKCEEVKRMLSAAQDMVFDIELQGIDISYEISRREFENLSAPLFQSIMGEVEAALELAKLRANDIDDVVLVGGSSRIPYIQQLLRGMFPKRPLCTSINPDEAIAIGAAVQAAALYRNSAAFVAPPPPPGPPLAAPPPPPPGLPPAGTQLVPIAQDRQPPPPSMASNPQPAGGPRQLPSTSTAPANQGLTLAQIQQLQQQQLQNQAMNGNGPSSSQPRRQLPAATPQEEVDFNLERLVVTNVTPLTLGIALSDGTMDILIPRGTPIPATKRDLYTTSSDTQRNVVIQVFEGERKRANENNLLGKFALDVPTSKELGRWPEIEVTFTVTGEGLFQVSAKDLNTGQKTSINIERSAGAAVGLTGAAPQLRR